MKIPPLAQRFYHPRTCADCGAIIRSGTGRPRLYCNDTCRQRASRTRRGLIRPTVKAPEPEEFCDTEHAWLRQQYRGLKNNSRATKRGSKNAEKSIAKTCHEKGGIETAFAGRWPLNLVGSQRFEAPWLDPVVIDQILCAELGVPVASAVSDDGVPYTITPRASNGKRGPI
jgi:hypothetical protein